MGARATPGAGRVVVEVTDRQRRVRVGRAWLAGVVRRAIRLLGEETAEVSVILVDDRRIARIHDEWMGDPTPTDVITFSLPAGPGDDGVLRGDIVVSVETAARVAAEVGWTTRLETAYGAIHGLLHLAGYDDLSPGPRRAMRRRERTLMEALGLPPPPRPRHPARLPPGKPRR